MLGSYMQSHSQSCNKSWRHHEVFMLIIRVYTGTEKEIMKKKLSYLPDAGQIEGMVQRDEQQQTRQGKHKLNSTCTSDKTVVKECTHAHSNNLCYEGQKQSAAPVSAYQTCTGGGPCILFELFGSIHCLSWQHVWLSSCSWFHTHAS